MHVALLGEEESRRAPPAAEEAKASMENGVLTLVVPKVEAKKPQVRSIEIEGGDGKKKRRRSEKGKKNKGEAVRCAFWHR